MVHKFYFLLWSPEVVGDRRLEALGVHISLEFLPLLVVLMHFLDAIGSIVFGDLEFPNLGVFQVANLPRVVNVEIELVRVETESLHFNIYIIFYG